MAAGGTPIGADSDSESLNDETGEMHEDKRGIMTTTAVGLFAVSTTADEVVLTRS